ncbi:2-succinyl-6-hydroxy-2,4-cyclohexadiene-1-carboxylate synthase [Metabacillus sp. FJAT-52054]|uniref:Putative 2-succinyl-6-hydroxy-2,4-cyclohexadiene-1-carboxylate synthase n=1 Tax=Metabacillus sediminis TaxID=3117746 RepID=A0ABZ2NFD9_9BACI
MIKTIRGVSYHFQVIGEGSPLLLLHGFTGAVSDWEEMIPVLTGRKLILIDLIGHGKTEAPAEEARYTMDEVCKDLAVILDELDINKAAVAGYSMGGRTALNFSMLFPERVSHLILESASPGLKTLEERTRRSNSDRLLAEKITTSGVASFVDVWEKLPLFSSQAALPQEKRRAIREQRLSNSTIGLANSLRGMGTGIQYSWWGQLHQCLLPVLILAGELDAKFCKIGREMDELFENSRYIEVNDAGHAIHVEQPKIFGTIVNGFLKQ